MLKLKNIKKDYFISDNIIRALRGIDINFRKNEFVSILGPSGCGKTTLLNLIGGLDKATDGDLLIWGKSTKKYKDHDWDIYRNHRIGFVFQSYNLIPHQTVLGNVELSLTIAGLDKETRIKKAKEALDKVGLSDQYYKKPNQLSGGQSQRVAIARALVNDPDILLADEPTGALDTKTSVQILDLIKEIAQDRLVIMVTHNPNLAEKYSTRIIKLLDGELIDDSNPYADFEEEKDTNTALLKQAEAASKENKKSKLKDKTKMSFWTAFKLSIQNIFTKIRRTTMTAIAGSIGIIGVSLVLSISIGLNGFIDDMQNDMLAGNPITIKEETFNINAMSQFSHRDTSGIITKGDYINVNEMIKELNDRLSKMDDFKVQNKITEDYIIYLNDMPQDYWSAITYDYGIDVTNSFYTNFKYPSYENGRKTSITGIKSMYKTILENVEGFEEYASFVGMLDNPFMQAPNTKNEVTEDYVLSQYNVLYKAEGSNGIAKEANEIMVVLEKDRMIADLTLGYMGYYSQDEFINIVYKAIGNNFDSNLYDGGKIDYEDLADITYTWYPNDTIFKKGLNPSIPFTYSPYGLESFDEGLPLKIVGILEPKDNLNYGMLKSGIYYTNALAQHIIDENYNSELATYLRENLKSDAFSGTAIVLKKGTDFNGVLLPEDMLHVIDGKVIDYKYEYILSGSNETKSAIGIIDSSNAMQNLMGMFMGNNSGISMVSYSLTSMGANVASEIIYDENDTIISWDVIIDENGKAFRLPEGISIYTINFQQKDKVLSWLDQWNGQNLIKLSTGTELKKDDREDIIYTDMLSLIMGMISNLLLIITIALIGFTSLSLIVSSVMIAIITYVSVVERIKEIGVIRSLGGRKKDVSNLFIAETFIIGLIAGLIGLIVTYLLSWIINIIVNFYAGVKIALFPWWVALIMLTISVVLTLISGLIPSKSAAKKDPVIALRTE